MVPIVSHKFLTCTDTPIYKMCPDIRMRPLLSVAPVARPLPRSLTLWVRINLDIPNHAVEGWPGQSAVAQRLWKLAETHTPRVRVTHYTQAIMDLGAILCTRSMCGFKRGPRG
jgi:hypothetical protein